MKSRSPKPAAKSFYSKVYALVKKIPCGRVSTYGTIAKTLGTGLSSRMVGYALHLAADTDVPCHRVVNRFGALTGKIHFGSPTRMQELLEAEGITFNTKGEVEMEKHFYDFKRRVKPGKKKEGDPKVAL